jgi:hypothetical protein
MWLNIKTVRFVNLSCLRSLHTKIDHVVNNIIPFFDKHSIRGSKYSDYLDFKSAALIIKNKEHLKEEGLKQILVLRIKKENYRFE